MLSVCYPSLPPLPPVTHATPLKNQNLQKVAAATKQWDGTGSFVFTSSMSVCATEDGSSVDENCPLVPQGKSPSTDRCVVGGWVGWVQQRP